MRSNDLLPVYFVFSFIFIISCSLIAQDDSAGKIESEMSEITLSDGTIPTIEWTGDIKIGRLLVLQGSREIWGTETEGKNTYQSPIRYNEHPADAVEQERAKPLKAGETYTVKLFRWVSTEPEEFQLVGVQEFTPSSDLSTENDESKMKGYKKFEEIDPKNFDNPIKIDNPYMPLNPGTKLVYEGSTVEDGESTPHRIEFVVTDLTKVINGINTVVIFDRDFADGLMEESELTYFAQDNFGNVWHLGQYSEVYDEVEFVGGRMWVVGHLEGAKAGIMMKAEPKMGAPSYSQGYAPPPFNWTDRARTYKMGEKTTVGAGTYDDVLITEEFNEEEPNAFQLKYYAKNIGNVRIGWRGDDQQQETMELVEYVTLNTEEMAEIRAMALELEKRAYVYGKTPPAEIRSKEK
jgi:hypothetical protein